MGERFLRSGKLGFKSQLHYLLAKCMCKVNVTSLGLNIIFKMVIPVDDCIQYLAQSCHKRSAS